tara:strand:+ start:450 stop:551 length:102 start_codon:yes stop_codon:yes gene_type:complete
MAIQNKNHPAFDLVVKNLMMWHKEINGWKGVKT